MSVDYEGRTDDAIVSLVRPFSIVKESLRG